MRFGRMPVEMENAPGRCLEAAGGANHEGLVSDPRLDQSVRPEILRGDDPGRNPLRANLHGFGPHAKSEPVGRAELRNSPSAPTPIKE